MIYKYFLLFITVSCVTAISYGQVNTYSPYSRFGLGEQQKPGFVKGLSMGSTGIALRTNKEINYLNPASFTATDTLSFLFDVGLNSSFTNYNSVDQSSSVNNLNFHHLAFSFPVTKWWKSAVGVLPYSSVGYNISESLSLDQIGNVDYFFEGNGGLNKFFIGNAIQLSNKINIGASINYMFGYIDYARSLNLSSDITSANFSSQNRMNFGSLLYQFGIQYTETFGEKYFLTLGATYEKSKELKTKSSSISQLGFPGNSVAVGDSVFISNIYGLLNASEEGTSTYPTRLGFGLSVGIKDILTLTGDYYMQDWSNAVIMGVSDSLINSGSFHFGAEYTPSPASIHSYLNRIHYRLGGFYSNSYINIRGEQIKDYGMTFGVGLPLRSSKTTFNIGGIVGKRGTLKNNLIEEKYSIVHIGFTFHDIWFRKRKYD